MSDDDQSVKLEVIAVVDWRGGKSISLLVMGPGEIEKRFYASSDDEINTIDNYLPGVRNVVDRAYKRATSGSRNLSTVLQSLSEGRALVRFTCSESDIAQLEAAGVKPLERDGDDDSETISVERIP
jgi:hypothetical protein